MYTFSYCEDTDECLADEWNYYNKWCTTGWQQGWKLNIFDQCNCLETEGQCQDFESGPEFEGTYLNDTKYLQRGQSCTITIDATKGVARVILEDQTEKLGVMYNGYVLGTPITIPAGEIRTITLFNGQSASEGLLPFEISFSAANKLVASMLTLAGLYFAL